MNSEIVGIVYNNCYGGFSLSPEAEKMYLQLKGFTPLKKESKFSWDQGYYAEGWEDFYDRDIPRNDPDLVKVVEKLGDKANGDCAKLAIEYLPKGTLYQITEYDGLETVETYYSEWSVA